MLYNTTMVKKCVNHEKVKAKWECQNCGETYCNQCAEESGECMSCIPPELIKIK